MSHKACTQDSLVFYTSYRLDLILMYTLYSIIGSLSLIQCYTVAPPTYSFSCPFCWSTAEAAPPSSCLLDYPLRRGWCHGWRVWHCRHWQGVDECEGQSYCRVLLALAWIGEGEIVSSRSGWREKWDRQIKHIYVQNAFMHSICMSTSTSGLSGYSSFLWCVTHSVYNLWNADTAWQLARYMCT